MSSLLQQRRCSSLPQKTVVVIGAGMVGVSAAIWLQRKGFDVTILERDSPASGASLGNACLLASCAMVPVTTPGLISQIPLYLLSPKQPVFMQWRYLLRLMPWLVAYLQHANHDDTSRVAHTLADLTVDSVEQHDALAGNTAAAAFLKSSEYGFAYRSRQEYAADAYVWAIRGKYGFRPRLLEHQQVQEHQPHLSPQYQLLALVNGHGYVLNPKAYIDALCDTFVGNGGIIITATAQDFIMTNDRIQSVESSVGSIVCDTVVLASGVWSKPLGEKMHINVPLEAERGYHVLFHEPSVQPSIPIMLNHAKFVATPMQDGLRCAGVVEFARTDAQASAKPVDFIMHQTQAAFPVMKCDRVETWMGQRPATPDSLPLIGQVRETGIYTAFGHQHIGLTAGAKTGRLIADLINDDPVAVDLRPCDPHRFGTT